MTLPSALQLGRRSLRQDGHCVRGDGLDLRGGTLELVVGEHRGALEREVAVSSTHEWQPWYSSRTFTVTGRGIR